MILCALVFTAFACVPQNPRVGISQIDRLIDVFLKQRGDVGYQAVLLLSQRPGAAREVINRRIKAASDETLKERLRALRQRVLTEGLKRILAERSKSGLIYSGQWSDLKAYDPDIGRLLLALVKEPFEDPQIKQAALNAIADLKLKKLIPELKAITEDILQPDFIIESAGLALAELGDLSWAEKRIAALEKIAASGNPDVPSRYSALKQLANFYYRLKRYDKAIRAYMQTIKILESRLVTLQGDEALFVRETLRLHYYNAACSASKAGDFKAAAEFLDKALANAVNRATMRELFQSVQEDGDLEAFRKDTRYRAFLEKLKTLLSTKPL